jgi:hypothetical protein
MTTLLAHTPAVAALTLPHNPALVALLAVFAMVNVALAIVALVSVIPRPAAAIRLHNRWVWVALILLVNVLGSLLYLAFGRIDAPLPDGAGRPLADRSVTDRAAAAVDLLYGPRAEDQSLQEGP